MKPSLGKFANLISRKSVMGLIVFEDSFCLLRYSGHRYELIIQAKIKLGAAQQRGLYFNRTECLSVFVLRISFLPLSFFSLHNKKRRGRHIHFPSKFLFPQCQPFTAKIYRRSNLLSIKSWYLVQHLEDLLTLLVPLTVNETVTGFVICRFLNFSGRI